MKRINWLITALILGFSISVQAGVDITTVEGTVFRNAEVKNIESGSAILSHSSGVARIPLTEFSKETRKLLGIKPTLKSAKSDFDDLLESFRSRFSELNDSYSKRLTELEKDAQAQDQLDFVVRIKKEIEALQTGAKLDPPKNEQLKIARTIYDQETVKRKEAVNADLKTALEEYRIDLQGIQAEPANANKIFEGAALKEELARIADLLTKPDLALDSLGILANETLLSSDPAVSFAAPGELPLCRIVMIPVKRAAGSTMPSTFEAVQTADKTNIVGVGRSVFPNIGVIQADGAMVYWKNGAPSPQVIPGSHVQCVQDYGTPLVGLERDGTINFTSDADESMIDELKNQVGIGQITATPGAGATVSRNEGIITVIGRSTHATAVALHSFDEVSSLHLAGLTYATVLKRDGSVFQINNGSVSEPREEIEFVKLHCSTIGETKTGSLIALPGFPQTVLNEIGENPRQVSVASTLFCAIERTGRFHCWNRDENRKYHQLEDIENALTGASAFAQIFGPGGEAWIYALLPTDTVPRSGVWEVSELIKARAK